MDIQKKDDSSLKKRQPWTSEDTQRCRDLTQTLIMDDDEAIAKASRDFGAIAHGNPTAVSFPRTPLECKALLDFANAHDFKFTIRGRGFSQGGQTLAPSGTVTIDCSELNEVGTPDLTAKTVTCQPGASWKEVVTMTSAHGLVPMVIPYFPELTVGGVLSIGGIGGNSHLNGTINSNVHELEVVTGRGDLLKCSATQESDLYEACLSGLGRCGVITSATLNLRPFKPNVKSFYLCYLDHETWLLDQKKIVESRSYDYLEAFCGPVPLGLQPHEESWKPFFHWFYYMQVSVEFEGEEPTKEILEGLSYQQILTSSVAHTINFLTRCGTRAENMKASGGWNQPHPWWECVFPFGLLSQILPSLLEKLPLFLRDGLEYRFFAVGKKGPPGFRLPSNEVPIGLAVIPMGVDPTQLQNVLDAFQTLDKWLLPLGGKRYLSGWQGSMTEECWKRHYGDYYEKWIERKKKYDPNNVFHSLLLDQSFL
jgi:cytokinin dehydrogenase